MEDVNEVNVSVVEMNSKSTLRKLNLNQTLSEIRRRVEEDTISRISFFRKLNDEIDEVRVSDEHEWFLREIITNVNGRYILYIKKSYWNTLINNRRLDYGRTMSFDGIKVAEKRAFKMKDCELTEFGADGHGEGTIKFSSKEDWIKKTNLFFSANFS